MSALPRPLVIALALRVILALLPQTFFQPDEFYQALEPAHHLVYGYGHLTWEWRDLPSTLSSGNAGWWDVSVVAGRMRGWLWPGVFALVYRACHWAGVDGLVIGPRLIGAVIAALTDYATYRLAIKTLGQGAGATAMFLSLTSLFNAHLLPRTLSTSPETLLTALALTYFPLPKPEAPRDVVVKGTTPVEKANAENARGRSDVVQLAKAEDLNYVVLDRMSAHVGEKDTISDNLAVAAFLAGMSVCIRPTTIPLWIYLGLEHMWRQDLSSAIRDVAIGVMSGSAAFAGSTLLDYIITGRLYFPILTFIHHNLLHPVSSFYGRTDVFYHLVQSLPIMLFPLGYWWAKGFAAALFPLSGSLDRPAGLRLLARAITFAIAILSLSPHSEWRFLHPFLPPLLLFAIPPLVSSHVAVLGANMRISSAFRHYLRIPKTAFYFLLLAPAVPFAYLNIWHGAAQVEVMNALRRGDVGEVTGLAALMPCHSTPWMSHLHRNIPAWFLTCEPPLIRSGSTQQDTFYADPIAYLEQTFSAQPGVLQPGASVMPSHVILFGDLLDQDEGQRRVADVLQEKGYRAVWYRWNGFDVLQDEPKRRGGVRVWRLDRNRTLSSPS